MSIAFRKGYIHVVAPTFVRWVGRMTTGSDTARAFAAFPFIVTTDVDANTQWVINHELIHFRQSFETLFIGLPIISFIEHQYARFFLKKSKMEQYLYGAAEQEAYINQQDFNYLAKRRFGTVYSYIKHKRNFTFGEPGQIVYLDVSD